MVAPSGSALTMLQAASTVRVREPDGPTAPARTAQRVARTPRISPAVRSGHLDPATHLGRRSSIPHSRRPDGRSHLEHTTDSVLALVRTVTAADAPP
ncbi:hypothetical protein ACH3WN_17090 [Streptomyces albogriseolus]|uniref:hypothetical protein n=1 Tax=Streptomyces albogriseolus TaxID=1887 RepID=UPI003789587D